MATLGVETMPPKKRACVTGMLCCWAVLVAIAGPVRPGAPSRAWAQERVLVNRIVAEVNEDIITLHELNQAAAPFLRRVRSMGRPLSEERQMLYEVRENMLNQLIEHKLTDQEVRRYNISVSEEAIDNAMEAIKKRRCSMPAER